MEILVWKKFFCGNEWVCDITYQVLLLMQVIHTEMRVKLG